MGFEDSLWTLQSSSQTQLVNLHQKSYLLLMSLGIRLEGFTEMKIYNMVWVKITAPCGVVHGYKVFFGGEGNKFS